VLVSGKDKKTPAMRLGLAKGPVKYEDILYFTGP
jgi:ribosomal protein S28E/S33